MYQLLPKIKVIFQGTNENNKIIIYNTMGAFLIKGAALVISLLTLPAYIKYFDNQRVLGLWYTILSVLSWILTFDLGVGNGLRNKLVPAIVNNDNMLIKKYISSGYFMIGTIVIAITSLSVIIFRFIDWNIVFNISRSLIPERILYITTCIAFSGIMLQFLFKIITSILYALQKSFLTNLLSLLSSIIILVYISKANSEDISVNLIKISIAQVLAVNIPLLIATLIIFSNKLKECKPNIKFLEKSYTKEIMIIGGLFFWVQIMYMIITATNDYLISWFTDPRNVVEYQIYNKLFTLIGTLFLLALTPIWSAVTKALAERNYQWIRKLYSILKMIMIFSIICEFGLIIILQNIIDLWLGPGSIQVNYFYAVIFAVSGSILICTGVFSCIANGFGELKIQCIFYSFGALIKIPLSWVLVEAMNSWVGVVLGSIISMILYCIIQPISLKSYMQNIELQRKE